MDEKILDEIIKECYDIRNKIKELETKHSELRAKIIGAISKDDKDAVYMNDYLTATVEWQSSPNEKFIQMLKETGNADLIKESCNQKNYIEGCRRMGIEQKQKCHFRSKKTQYLYIEKTKKRRN